MGPALASMAARKAGRQPRPNSASAATLAAEGRSEREERARVTDQLVELDPEEYPLLTQHGGEFARLLDEDVFAWGLSVVLDGLRARFGKGKRRRG